MTEQVSRATGSAVVKAISAYKPPTLVNLTDNIFSRLIFKFLLNVSFFSSGRMLELKLLRKGS